MRCAYTKALFAIVGTDGLAYGVLFWHDNELDAWRDAREVNKNGGKCRVISAPGGSLTYDQQREVDALIDTLVGQPLREGS